MLILVFCGGDYLLERFLKEYPRQQPQSITFTSDRKPVTLLQSDILFVESNDAEVWIHSEIVTLSDGQVLPVSRKYRERIPTT